MIKISEKYTGFYYNREYILERLVDEGFIIEWIDKSKSRQEDENAEEDIIQEYIKQHG